MAVESSDRHDPQPARAWQDAVLGDRQRLAGRARAPAWYYPLLGLATAAIIACPGVDSWAWGTGLLAGACAAIVFLESAYKKESGLSTHRMAGPRSLLVLLGMGVIVLPMLVLAAVFTGAGLQPWVLVSASVGFPAVFPRWRALRPGVRTGPAT